jgi:hypothetical protein
VIAHAALPTHSFGTSTTSSGPSVVTVAPTAITSPAPAAPASGTGSTASNTVIAPTNTTQSDQRAAATDQAVQPERSSANTSASQILTATASQPGGSATGTTSGGTTTTTGGTTTGIVVGSSLGFPGSVGTIVNSGEPAVDANGNIVGGIAAYSATPAAAQVAMAAPVYSSAEVAYADNTMNQVIGEAKRDRHRVGRNGQLLYSIAPRTNVDRSREVPDDGPSPALTGPLAR